MGYGSDNTFLSPVCREGGEAYVTNRQAVPRLLTGMGSDVMMGEQQIIAQDNDTVL